MTKLTEFSFPITHAVHVIMHIQKILPDALLGTRRCFPGLLMLEGCSTSVWSPLVIITPRGLQKMGGTLVGHMCGSRGDSEEELNITENCRTNLPAPSHMLMREQSQFSGGMRT